MRIGLVGFIHETNVFAAQPTLETDFQIVRGRQIVDELGHDETVIAGFLSAAIDDVHIEPLIVANAEPGGLIPHEL